MVKKLSMLLVLLLLAVSMTVFAQTDDAAFNECFAGGVMEGRCHEDFDDNGAVDQYEIDWAWNCGWYLARWNAGQVAREDFPDWCASLLFTVVPQWECIIWSSYTYCLIGNYIKEDLGNDGSFERSFYIVSGTIAGNDGLCPPGSSYALADVGDYVGQDIYTWLIGKGFANYDDFCIIA